MSVLFESSILPSSLVSLWTGVIVVVRRGSGIAVVMYVICVRLLVRTLLVQEGALYYVNKWSSC